MDRAMTADVFQTPAVTILCDLERDGFHVELRDDGALAIAPRSRLTPERMAAITACKVTLKTLLRCCDDGVQTRRDTFRRVMDAAAPGTLPALLFRPDVPYVKGTCFSCADKLPEPRFGRCWRCSLAWRLACRLPIDAALADALDGAKVCA